MRLPPAAIEEFRQLYEKRFGERLSDAEAFERAMKLFDLFCAVYGPPCKEQRASPQLEEGAAEDVSDPPLPSPE